MLNKEIIGFLVKKQAWVSHGSTKIGVDVCFNEATLFISTVFKYNLDPETNFMIKFPSPTRRIKNYVLSPVCVCFISRTKKRKYKYFRENFGNKKRIYYDIDNVQI